MFGLFKKKQPPQEPPRWTPPVPAWKPDIVQPVEEIVERIRHYTDGRHDLVVFAHGTCVVLVDTLTDADATVFALQVLHDIIHAHPDMSPARMKDDHVLVQYNHPAMNLVLEHVARAHWDEIDRNHLRALTDGEVLHTENGPNVFDDFGKRALFGRCFLFMDALDPVVVGIVRKEG